MGNSYAERVQRDRQRYLDIGLDSGAQIVHDMLCVALRDKQAMGDDVWGRERIVRLLTRLNELKEDIDSLANFHYRSSCSVLPRAFR